MSLRRLTNVGEWEAPENFKFAEVAPIQKIDIFNQNLSINACSVTSVESVRSAESRKKSRFRMRVSQLIMSGSTVVVGLNGALQKRFVLPSESPLVPGNVHRAKEVQFGVGGKGQDVAVTLSCLQFQGDLQLAQFVGSGAEGDTVYTMLEELLGESAMGLTVRPASGMRTCTSIVGSDTTTELVEPSGTIAEEEMEEFMSKLQGVQASALCIMGSMPPGCSSDTYAKIYNSVAVKSTLCLIDSVSGLDTLLEAIAKSPNHGPTILKVNASELCRLSGIDKTSSEAGGVLTEELVQAIPKFLTRYEPHAAKALTAIAVTDGPHPAYLAILPVATEDEFRLFQLPIADLGMAGEGDNVQSLLQGLTLYPIGAGDAVAGGTLAAWKALIDDPKASPCVHPDIQTALEGNETPAVRVMLTAFSFGLACGSASCLIEQNSVLKIQDALSLYRRTPRPAFLSSHKISVPV
jgi:fructose-1-phosphate kinase PfkB-like protein